LGFWETFCGCGVLATVPDMDTEFALIDFDPDLIGFSVLWVTLVSGDGDTETSALIVVKFLRS